MVLALLLLAIQGHASSRIITTVDSLNREAKRYYDISFPEVLRLASAAQQISVEQKYTKGVVSSTCLISLVYINISRNEMALRSLQAVSQAAQDARDPGVLMELYSAKGVCWSYNGNYDSAKLYHEMALQVCPSGPSSLAYAYECMLQARVYIKNGSPERALEYYEKAAGVFKKQSTEDAVAWAQDLLGDIYYEQRLYEKAIVHLDYAQHSFQNSRQQRGTGSALLHKGNVYYMLIKDDSAKACYLGALSSFTALGDSNGMAMCYSNLSRIYLEGGKHQEAIAYANRALETIRPGNYIVIEAGTYQQLGDIYGELKQYDKAVAYVQKALAAARTSDNKVIVKDCYKSLSELYQLMKKPDLALLNLRAAYRLKDTIEPLTFSKQLAEMEARYKTEKKETEIKLLKQQWQINSLKMEEQCNTLRRQRILMLLLVFVIVVIFVAIYFNIARRKLLEQIRQQNIVRETEEKERIRIAKDIHDELGSGLSRIKMLSELANTGAHDRLQLSASLHSISETSKGLVENMRDLIWAMNPEHTTLDNLVARIREYTCDYLEDLSIEVEFHFPAEVPDQKISKEVNRNVFMIVKEALQNIVKHAGATAVVITITLQPKFRMEIQDNGVGYDLKSKSGGNGLRNMNARGAALGAQLTMDSQPGKGSRIAFEIELTSGM